MKNIVILLAICLTTITSSCKKLCFSGADTVFNFKIEAKAYPDKDSIRIGDTIWFEVNTSTSLTDIASNNIINYSGAENLGTALRMHKFTGGSFSNPGAVFAADDFNYILLNGYPIDSPSPDRVSAYLFKEINNLYSFKVAVIPKKIGIFSINLSNGVNVYRKSDKCTKAGFEISFQNTDQHLYLYQNNRPGYVISSYEQKHMYCFKVYE